MAKNVLSMIASQAKSGPPDLPMGMTPQQRSEFLRNIVEDIKSGRIPNPAETEKPGFRSPNLPRVPFDTGRPTSGPTVNSPIINRPFGQPPINNAPKIGIQPQYPLKYAAPGPKEDHAAAKALDAATRFIYKKLTAPQAPGKTGVSLGSGGLVLNAVKQVAARSPLGVALAVLYNDAREIVVGVPKERRLINRPFYDQTPYKNNSFFQDMAPIVFGLSDPDPDEAIEPPDAYDISEVIVDALAHVERSETRMIGILEWTDP